MKEGDILAAIKQNDCIVTVRIPKEILGELRLFTVLHGGKVEKEKDIDEEEEPFHRKKDFHQETAQTKNHKKGGR